MELSPDKQETLKKAALSAVALVVGGRIVRYVFHPEKKTAEAYVYYFKKTGTALVGLLKPGAQPPVEIRGTFAQEGDQETFVLQDADIQEEDVAEFERIFPDSDDEQT
jgi:hypothetical protein